MSYNKFVIDFSRSTGCSMNNYNQCRSNLNDICCFLYIVVAFVRHFQTQKTIVFYFSDNEGDDKRIIAKALSDQFIESRIFSINQTLSDEKLMKTMDTNLYFVWWDQSSISDNKAFKLLSRMSKLHFLEPPKIWIIVTNVYEEPTILMQSVPLSPCSVVAVIQTNKNSADYSMKDVYSADEINSLATELIGSLSIRGNVVLYNKLQNFPNIIQKLNNYKLRVGARKRPPFIDYDPEKDKLSGVLGEILLTTQEIISLRYDVHLSGENNATKTWDVFEELRSNISDLILGVHSITKYRFKLYTFSYAVAFGRFQILFKRPQIEPLASVYTAPFTTKAWISIIIFSLIIAIDLTVTDKVYFTSLKKKPKKSARNCPDSASETCDNNSFKTSVFFAISALLQRGTAYLPQNRSNQVICFSYFIFALLTFSTYTSKLFSFLTIYTQKLPFESITDMIDNTNFNVTVILNSSSYYLFRNAKRGLNLKIKNRIAKHVEDSKAGLDYVYSHKDTVFLDHDIQVFTYLRGNCSIATIPMAFYYKHGFYLVFSKHHPIYHSFNYVLSMMHERGILYKITNSLTSDVYCDEDSSYKSITFDQIHRLLLAWLIGVTISILACIVECFIDQYFPTYPVKKIKIKKKLRQFYSKIHGRNARESKRKI